MSYDSEVQDEIKQGFLKQIADKFIQHLEKLKDAPDYVKRRWVWELLQNPDNITPNVPVISLTNVPGVSVTNEPGVSPTNVPQ